MKAKQWLGLVVLVMALSGCGPEKLAAVPAELVGRWTTDYDQYTDRYIELQPNVVRFGTGEDTFVEHTVLRLEREEKEGVMEYTVFYLDQNMEQAEWKFVHDRGRGNVIRLMNPKMEWTKQPPSAESLPGATE